MGLWICKFKRTTIGVFGELSSSVKFAIICPYSKRTVQIDLPIRKCLLYHGLELMDTCLPLPQLPKQVRKKPHSTPYVALFFGVFVVNQHKNWYEFVGACPTRPVEKYCPLWTNCNLPLRHNGKFSFSGFLAITIQTTAQPALYQSDTPSHKSHNQGQFRPFLPRLLGLGACPD